MNGKSAYFSILFFVLGMRKARTLGMYPTFDSVFVFFCLQVAVKAVLLVSHRSATVFLGAVFFLFYNEQGAEVKLQQ